MAQHVVNYSSFTEYFLPLQYLTVFIPVPFPIYFFITYPNIPSLCAEQALSLGNLARTVLLEANSASGNESRGIHRRESGQRVHGGVLFGVQVAGLAASAKDVDIALVGGHADLAVDVLLRVDDAVLDELAFGGEVHAVVELTGPGDGYEQVAELTDHVVDDETLEI